MPLVIRPSPFEFCQYLVMTIERREMHSKVKTGGMQEAQQGRHGGLAQITFVSGNHGWRHTRLLGKFRLAEPAFQARQLE